MKKITFILLLSMVITGFTSCKKFLNVTPVDNLSGNNYWKSTSDVEGYANGLYARLRTKFATLSSTTSNRTTTGNYLFNAADLRCAPAVIQSGVTGMDRFIQNDVRAANDPDANVYLPTVFGGINKWKVWYDVIQGANIMVKEVGDMDPAVISEAQRKAYIAEAIFLRNFCYFFMVRLYGDVPYYTDAYNEKALPRMPQVQVMKNAIADLTAVKGDLPVRYDDQGKNGNRAMRGSAIGLLMHMNQWAASFDKGNEQPYYSATVTLAEELATYTQYSLIRPFNIQNNKKLFKGGTNEVLFEFIANVNYGEGFKQLTYSSDFFSHYPLKGEITKTESNGYYEEDFMKKLFPAGEPDLRKDVWLESYDLGNYSFQLKKYTNTYISGTNFTVFNDDNVVVFRLADMLLLAAEAANKLGQDDKALIFANQVRDRAGKTPLTSTGETLDYDIYLERTRELFCEGQYFYDLVRTRRILPGETSSTRISPGRTISPSDFNNGAWTWTIDASAMTNNPYMTLNNYWR
ncbi:MAG: RagB/SusD family nutrient uptake outer membrane protein [Flavobacteriales bacterium]|nr:MAG: RagB/SusD family nutrient uptake outer membrane protein [Flavobacteriales bacterium]